MKKTISLMLFLIKIISINAIYLNLDLCARKGRYGNITLKQTGRVLDFKVRSTFEANKGNLITSVSCGSEVFYEDINPGDTTRRIISVEVREPVVLIKIESEYLGYKETKYYLNHEDPVPIEECEYNKYLYDDDERLKNLR
ncbi:Theileria-specific hypothetical protein, putative [Theileria annulata]|uniref:Uncharacterized protein n=1 Tax=Theileria annulata TaxID=5874 RepID=Q4UBD8_THEAN|nr:Theileria-specific hypothetical protein, putative [Theileria annulata]CAI75863.1 Theileria-specific hypothetical protein, putative [Theileria annulata]|eukprot:XP_955339.1 Theileria-specific hypothetical protein, putative [Theileria annulata]